MSEHTEINSNNKIIIVAALQNLTPVSVAGKVWQTPAHSPLEDEAHLHLTSSPSASDTVGLKHNKQLSLLRA